MDMESLMPIVFLDVGRTGEGRKKGAQSGVTRRRPRPRRRSSVCYCCCCLYRVTQRGMSTGDRAEKVLAAQVGAVHSAL